MTAKRKSRGVFDSITTGELETLWRGALLEEVESVVERSGIPYEQWSRGFRNNAKTIVDWEKEGLDHLTKYIDWLTSTGWTIATMPDGKPGIEWEGDAEFGGTNVRFIVDGIYDDGAGNLIVVDYKSGSKTPTGVLQLALYASGIEKLTGIRPAFGGFYMTRTGKLDNLVNLDAWGIEYFEYAFTTMNRQLELGLYSATVDEHCRFCSVSKYCAAYSGANALDINQIKEKNA